jgi:osmotically-inducible protein OsmY
MNGRIAMMASGLILVLISGCTTVRVPDDDVITARVKSELGRAVPRTATDITVTSYDGVVGITGPIVSRDAARRAVDAAKQVDGVRAVQYDLWLAAEAAH